jgi:hypothetical protein
MVTVPSAVVVDSTLTTSVAAVVGIVVATGGKTFGGSGGNGVDVGIAAITMGVGVAPPHPLKNDSTSGITIHHFKICLQLISRSFHFILLIGVKIQLHGKFNVDPISRKFHLIPTHGGAAPDKLT